jgi:hypothetical protein
LAIAFRDAREALGKLIATAGGVHYRRCFAAKCNGMFKAILP